MRGRSSPKKAKKPRITIVGAGNLAHALAASLYAAGYLIDQIVARGSAGPLRRAKSLAARVGASPVAANNAEISAEVVWFCVPDGEIAKAAASLETPSDWTGKVALHSSGALTSDELSSLKKRGARVASVHPLMTFVRGSQPSLADVPFAIEGDRIAVRAARAIVSSLQGKPFAIRKKNKAAYHCWGMFTSPLLIALLATAEEVALAADIPRRIAEQRTAPILRQTLANYARMGGPQSFSGPLARGDVETVKRHLDMLQKIPFVREAYVSLARAALAYLPIKNRRLLESLLN